MKAAVVTKANQTLIDEEPSLYAKRKKIYPRIAFGFFSRLKALSGIILLGIYYLFPWFQWNNRQAVLFDLPGRQFHVFSLTFWPQDFIYLAFLLIIAGISLFFFTTLAGRLWCGFACPQTIWTDSFLWLERLVEGNRSQQIKLDHAPLTLRKFRIKATKHLLWLTFALWTGFTFIGYFTPIRELGQHLISFNLSGWETFWLLFYSLATYGNAGWLREQICTYMCPYARFQSAMFDKETLIIAYDERRGEPRGSRKRKTDPKTQGLGDCINCTMCVQVCPVGIDIRDGLQYQCISCSACIDACDEIMDKMNYPRGLVRYTTENSLNGIPTQGFRPRIFVYGGILLALFIGLIYAISTRVLIQVDVIRDRNSLFRETITGLIENVYTLKIMNMDDKPHRYEITVNGIEGLQLAKYQPIEISASTVEDISLSLLAKRENLHKPSMEVTFQFVATDDPQLTVTEQARFLGPFTP
jgi:cytochrome c oxidase accessory protein FixG